MASQIMQLLCFKLVSTEVCPLAPVSGEAPNQSQSRPGTAPFK